MKKSFVFCLLAAAWALPSFASTVYEGSDTACFYEIGSCTLVSSPSSTGVDSNGNPFLTYTPDSTPFVSDGGGLVTLGTFSVATGSFGGDAANFDVDVTFTEPGDGGGTYSATTLGVVAFGVGGAELTFNNPTTLLYSTTGGSFDLTLPTGPITIGKGDTVNLEGTITPISSTPEPASVGTFTAGFMLLGIAVYRRRIAKTASL